jgi:nicotinamidase/pyrazinamidase
MHLLIIDPQNDFMDLPASTLPVQGACAHMSRLANVIDTLGPRIDQITITLDCHHFIGIERTTFWRDAKGHHVEPYTEITAASVQDGTHRPFDPNPEVLKRALDYVTTLEEQGRYKLRAWPVHCVEATWGYNVFEPLMMSVHQWELTNGRNAFKLRKGMNPWTEQYGAFEAEVPVNSDPTTKYNKPFLMEMAASSRDGIYVAGEASSHCVRESVYQMTRSLYEGGGFFEPSQITLLHDCMGWVDGYRDEHTAFLGIMAGRGAKLKTAGEVLHAPT